MNALTRWESYTPISVGLEDFFNRLDKLTDTGTNFPPYNLLQHMDGSNELIIALAGYKRENLTVEVERHVLTVKGTTKKDENIRYVHRGLALRDFERSWQLGEDVVVDGVNFEDGLLIIRLHKEVPEEHKRKVLTIT